MFYPVLVLFLAVTGCREEPGRVKAKQHELVGLYEAIFDGGREVLELKNDLTYVQNFASPVQSTNHTGIWKLETHFLDGSKVVLVSALVSENDKVAKSPRLGDRILNVHNRGGQLALALNETLIVILARDNRFSAQYLPSSQTVNALVLTH